MRSILRSDVLGMQDFRSLRWTMCALVALLAGCTDSLPPPIPTANPDNPAPVHGGTIRTATAEDIRSLDPASTGDGLAPIILQHIFAGLVDYDRQGNIVPILAERIEQDALTFAFPLRRGVHFQDGSELTAADVVRSVERALAPNTPNPSKSFYSSIDGFDAFTTGKAPNLKGVTADGRYRVTFRLATRDATFLSALALHILRPVCPSMGSAFSADSKPCGAGPYRLEAWVRGSQITLARHENYFEPGKPYADRIVLELGTSHLTQRFKFERGELDVLREFLSQDQIRFQRDSRWTPFGFMDPAKQMGGEGMNTEMPPFDNVELRRAVAAAINRHEYHLIRSTDILALDQPTPPAITGYDPNLSCQPFNIEAALAHMARAGYPYDPVTGHGGFPQVIPYVAYRGGVVELTAQLLKQQLARIGIRIEIRLLSYAAWIALSHRKGQVAISYQGWNADFSDPSDFLEPLFHSSAINDDDSNNAAFYRNPALDRLLDEGRKELESPKARADIYKKATRIVCDDAPWAFTYAIQRYKVHQPYVRGYLPHPFWETDLQNAWVDKKERASAALSPLHRILPARRVGRDAWQ